MKLLLIIFFLTNITLASTLKMAIMGDAGLTGTDLDHLKSSIQNEKIQSLILPGDNLYFGRYNWTWNSWKKTGFQFDVVAIGNHNGGYQKEIEYFNMPGEYFSILKYRARFLVLNSDNTNNVQEQMTWLRSELEKASEKLIFLVYHHPSFKTGADHDWRSKEVFQLQMHQIFRKFKNKISAIIVGHEHHSSFLRFDNIPVILAGSGREVLKASPVSYQDEGFFIQTLFLAPEQQHWALLEINKDSSEAIVHFIRVSDQFRSCSAQLKNNKIKLFQNCMKSVIYN